MIVNIVASPCAGKSTLACSLFSLLKKNHLNAEYVSEYAKQLVWEKKFELLNNQYYVANQQYKMIKSIENQVDFLVCDSPLFMSLIYNEYNRENVSDVHKTKKFILKKMEEFPNSIYIFIKRDQEILYDNTGRVHTKIESLEIENLVENLLNEQGISYLEMKTGDDTLKAYNYIMKKAGKELITSCNIL